jgi:hypothetical protein
MSRMTKEEIREMVDLARRMRVIQAGRRGEAGGVARDRAAIRGARFGARG